MTHIPQISFWTRIQCYTSPYLDPEGDDSPVGWMSKLKFELINSAEQTLSFGDVTKIVWCGRWRSEDFPNLRGRAKELCPTGFWSLADRKEGREDFGSTIFKVMFCLTVVFPAIALGLKIWNRYFVINPALRQVPYAPTLQNEIQKSLDENPNDPNLLAMRGGLSMHYAIQRNNTEQDQITDYFRGVADFEKVLEIEPNHPYAKRMYPRALKIGMGDYSSLFKHSDLNSRKEFINKFALHFPNKVLWEKGCLLWHAIHHSEDFPSEEDFINYLNWLLDALDLKTIDPGQNFYDKFMVYCHKHYPEQPLPPNLEALKNRLEPLNVKK